MSDDFRCPEIQAMVEDAVVKLRLFGVVAIDLLTDAAAAYDQLLREWGRDEANAMWQRIGERLRAVQGDGVIALMDQAKARSIEERRERRRNRGRPPGQMQLDGQT